MTESSKPPDDGDERTPFEAAKADFLSSFDRLADNARKEGVRPVQAILSTYVQKGMDRLDRFFRMVEGGEAESEDPKKKE
tara:strand:+ start:287 stop:526 length:240 start_codon:yes stop_codon:yes gene_type:complete